ncbi:MAG: hypothetical protein JXN59_17765 [Anaerolineae bacterium]|nr:hypothetical protein [Anaerolineae bacterium]
MYVKINRDVCDAQLAFCERCLGKFLREPMGYERHCFDEIVDDGKDEVTIEIHSGENQTVLVLTEEQRLQAAQEGWSFFVDFIPDMYRGESD